MGDGIEQQPEHNDGIADITPSDRETTPSVLAVIVAHNPGHFFEETLESFANQDYPRLEVVVVDTANDSQLAARVQKHLPDASILDASDTDGFSEAANAILDTHLTPLFLFICHDDVALASDAIRLLVVESLRSNAGIVGPKIVDWQDPSRLQHVAYVVDRLAGATDVVEPNEIDQEQYDGVVDVFAVPSAAILIRTDLFRKLQGFDPQIPFYGEDVDLCFRAQLAGARVMAVPDAKVRHREKLSERCETLDATKQRSRHQLRTVMVTSSVPSLCYLLPIALLFSITESAVALTQRNFSQIGKIWRAWSWNLARIDEIRLRRKSLRDLRRVRYADVRAQQHRKSMRLGVSVRDGHHNLISKMRTGTTRSVVIVSVMVALFVLFGSRVLLATGVPVIGDYLAFADSGSEMLQDWWNGWRERDMGTSGAPASAGLVFGVLGVVSGGAVGLLRTLWVLAPLAVGLIGAFRMLRSSGSRWAQIASLLVYLVLPLPYAAVANGSIGGIYAYALAPWLLAGLLKVQLMSTQSGAPRLGWVAVGGSIGVALGITALFDHSASLILVLILAPLLLASVCTFGLRSIGRLLGSVLVALPIVGLLALPLLMDLLVAGPSWQPFANGRDGSGSILALLDIVSFNIGPKEPNVFIWALAVLLVIPLLIGRSWRFALALRGWLVALTSWGFTWVAALGLLPFGVADNSVLLASGAAAVALICGVTVLSFENDLVAAGFGWRQLLLPLAALAGLLVLLPGLTVASTGRWDMPRGDYQEVLPFAEPGKDGSYRVLWIGSPETLTGDGRHLLNNVAWLLSLDGPLKLSDAYPSVDEGAAPLVRSTLLRALDGTTTRAGRELGGLGIRYVVLLNRLAPAPFVAASQDSAIPAEFRSAMASQLDLAHLGGINSAVDMYINTEWTSVRAAASPNFDSGISQVADLAVTPITGSAGVLAGRGTTLSGDIPDDTEIFLAQTADAGWQFEVAGASSSQRRSLGYATVFSPATGGFGELTYTTEGWRHLVLVAQVLALAGMIMVFLIRGYQR